jgi:hypothetical protein
MVFETLVFFTVQPLDSADSPREFHYTQSPVKHQILYHNSFVFCSEMFREIDKEM